MAATRFESDERAREMGRLGGIASGQARRARRTLRECLEARLEQEEANGMTAMELITDMLVRRALEGDAKAYCIIRDTLLKTSPARDFLNFYMKALVAKKGGDAEDEDNGEDDGAREAEIVEDEEDDEAEIIAEDDEAESGDADEEAEIIDVDEDDGNDYDNYACDDSGHGGNDGGGNGGSGAANQPMAQAGAGAACGPGQAQGTERAETEEEMSPMQEFLLETRRREQEEWERKKQKEIDRLRRNHGMMTGAYDPFTDLYPGEKYY